MGLLDFKLSFILHIIIGLVKQTNWVYNRISIFIDLWVFTVLIIDIFVAYLTQVKCPITNENTDMFVAGIVTLVVGLVSLTAAVVFVFRNGKLSISQKFTLKSVM